MGRIRSKKSNRLHQLYHPASGNDGRNTKFHESTTRGSENDASPIKRIASVRSFDSEEWNLRADKINEEGNGSVNGFLVD